MKNLKSLFLLLFSTSVIAQVSIHEEQLNYYNNLGLSAEDHEQINQPASVERADRNCNLNKVVYGWHPYWSNGLQSNYDWDLLSHLCYFSYEVDANTGNALSTHSFSTAQAVTDALNNGVRVDLCVTLFSNHATFLGNATSRQTLITNLINLISSRGAHGVNIDFEGIPSSQAANFTTFMNDLANQMHAAIPGSQVSTVLYAVDWNNVFDVANMPNVDLFVIMGYDYYWNGSTTTGPNDPLFHFGSTYNYTLSKSVTYYLDKGVPKNKLILGLPYYGREWGTSSSTVPTSTTTSGTARTYKVVRDNTSGFFSSANQGHDDESVSTYYVYSNSGWRQCFITMENDMATRFDFINKRGIGGMGIWALGYDDGYADFWNLIADYFSDCGTAPCTESLYDIGGGPFKNYYNDEDYTFTLSPPNSQSITVNFSSFNIENNFDYLYIYDGPNTSSPQISGSPFTGTNSPGTFTSSGGTLTFRFTSDGATVGPGWTATYSCNQDNIAPVTTITSAGNWKTNDFVVNFTDSDNPGGSGISSSFWQVMDFDGTEWRANGQQGFFNDNFSSTIHGDWTSQTGTWSINNQHLNMSDEAEQNSNLYAAVTQNNSSKYLYHWQASMDGSGTNRRSGIHFFADNPTLPNRGNSYFVYFRIDTDKCQIYKVVNDVFTLITDDPVNLNPNTWYDYKVIYDPVSGVIKAYVNEELASSWTDPSPITSGNYISLRSGGTNILYDDVKVYRSRGNSSTVTIGSNSDMVRFQNSGPLQNSCRIRSVVKDQAENWSSPATLNKNIDWTSSPISISIVDGPTTDVDTIYSSTQYEINWTAAIDPHSDIASYEVSIGSTPGDSSLSNWINAGNNLSYSITGLSLTFGQSYFANVRSVNGAGLKGSIYTSDGAYLVPPTAPATASFQGISFETCQNDSITLMNTSSNSSSYLWNISGASPFSSTDVNPTVLFNSSGTYLVQLIAYGPGGNDTLIQAIDVNIYQRPIADFSVNDSIIYLPNAFLAVNNTSQNSSSYSWTFGEGSSSSDVDPWFIYPQPGIYELMLVAGNSICGTDTLIQTIQVFNSTDISEDQFSTLILKTHPSGFAWTLGPLEKETLIHVTDMTGRIVRIISAQNKWEDINLEGQSGGIYFLHLSEQRETKAIKLFLQK